MNQIKGLITKDLLELKSFKRTLIVFIFIFTFSALTQKDSLVISNTFVSMLALGFGMMSIATFGYDDQAKSDKYMLSLPVSKKDVIISKYILVIICTIIGAIIGIIGSYIAVYALKHEVLSFIDLVATALSSILAIGLLECLQIPCIVKYGSERGRMQVFVVIGIVVLLGGVILTLLQKLNLGIDFEMIVNIFDKGWGVILPVGIIIEFLISYLISYNIYKKKEF